LAQTILPDSWHLDTQVATIALIQAIGGRWNAPAAPGEPR